MVLNLVCPVSNILQKNFRLDNPLNFVVPPPGLVQVVEKCWFIASQNDSFHMTSSFCKTPNWARSRKMHLLCL
jgi:hypothetical protein